MKRKAAVLCLIAVVCLAGTLVEWANRYAVAVSAAEFESYDTRDGKKEAEADLAKGHAKWKVYGLYRHNEEDALRLRRLGIQVDWFAGCIASDGIERYAYRYNSAIYAYHVSLVGEDITKEVLGPPPEDPRQAQ